MKRIDAFGATGSNQFTSGDPVSGVPATRVSADYMNCLQEEVAHVIEYAGLTVDQATTFEAGNDITQLRQAIQALIAATGGVPVGTITAYGGTSVPSGWLECNGAELLISGSPELYAAIGTSWGGATSDDLFNIPDLRGLFLRGQDNGAGVDPNAASRTAIAAGGNSGDAVGSYQDDGLKAHSHSLGIPLADNNDDYAGPPSASNGALVGVTYNMSTANSGGLETRPKNAAVKYIIKAGTYVLAS